MAKKTNSNAATEETTKTVEVSTEQKLRAVNSRQREKIKTLEAYGKKMKLQLLDCRSENISNCFELQQQLNSAHEIEMESSKDFFTILIISIALLTFIAGVTLGIVVIQLFRKMSYNIKERDIIMLDDVSPISTQPKKGKMKKTSRYYKKKHARFQFFKENNNVFIIPTLRIYYDKFYNNKFDRLLLEVSWLNYTFAIKFI